ncbi:MAG: choice-of-anchor Q domain-containing protein, partial [Bacteroidota bacterium]
MLTRIHKKTIIRLVLVWMMLMEAFGAQHASPVLASTWTVTSTGDSGPGSLRQAIADAVSGDVITFDPSLAGQTITLASDIVIDPGSNEMVLTIDGSGLLPQVTISGGDLAHFKLLTPTDITISDLTVVHGYGGAIQSLGKLTVINSTLKNNQGGAIQSIGTLTLRNSTIAQNQGGGILIYGTGSTILNSTITQNQADANDGGGIAIRGGGMHRILNSTVTQNSAASGGGISIYQPATVDVDNSTFAHNSAARGTEIKMVGYSYMDVTNTIFVCIPESSNCYEGGSTPIALTNSILATGTLYDYGLAALADNGGPTQTMALLPGSPLIDTGSDAGCAATDQRGITRPKGSHCDIGAYELEEAAQVPLPDGWVGGVSISSDKKVVSVGRPHIGAEVASYDGFAQGSLSAYVPMLFKKAYGTYNSALYVQNVHASNLATVTIKYYDSEGILQCTKNDTIPALSSKGYWLPTETCNSGSLNDGFVGGAVVTSN